MKSNFRIFLWFLTIGLLLLACTIYAQATATHDSSGELRAYLGIFIGMTGLSSVFLFPISEGAQAPFQRTSPNRRTLLLALFLPAALARILLLPSAPSDDIHRYLWEGNLLNKGKSPYSHTADHPSYQDDRDKHWQSMNHRDQPTAYPPLALRSFQLINKISYTPLTYQIVFLLLDLALIAVLLALLRHFHLPLRWIGFYALSPLSLMSYAAEAHFDILMVLPFCAAILAHQQKKWWLCGLLLGIAVGMKCMIAVAVPFFFLQPHIGDQMKLKWIVQRIHWSSISGFLLALFLPLLGFTSQLIPIFEAILLFGSSRSFNGPSYQILEWLFDSNSRTIPNAITVILYTLVWIKAARYALANNLISSILWSLGGLVLLSPTVHFWYLAWILPLICIRPHPLWLTLSISGPLYFLVWQNQVSLGEWALPIWARWAFWLPSLLAYSPKSLSTLFSLPILAKPSQTKPTLSIIIPTLNPGKELETCLHSIPREDISEIIIIDASKTPPTLPESSLTTVLSRPELKGRGSQIKAGAEKATGDWALVLHADATLHPRAITTLHATILAQPNLIGGCLGQRYDRAQMSLSLLESLNELRASCFHTSYGDQTQFFHRKTALDHHALSDQPLMEDIEISQRLYLLGHTSYLGIETQVSASKWPSTGIVTRFTSLITLLIRYHFLTFGRRTKKERLSHQLYQEYYNSKNTSE